MKLNAHPLLLRPCRSPDQLHHWIELFLGLIVPRECVCEHHNAPFEYLTRAYFEPADDLIVWAPRGGGKTRLAAAATLLDLLHKPGVSVRILGGSLEQSLKMWEHLLPDAQRLAGHLIEGPGGVARRFTLRSGSTASVLTQSERAVRGLRVQKLRCDEVELFDPDVWEAAQLVTRSRSVPPADSIDVPRRRDTRRRDRRGMPARVPVAGTIEALSTLHRPQGLMHRLIESAESGGAPRVLRWCLLEVLQRCPPERPCQSCPLWDDCNGVAKTRCAGFVSIDDAIAMKRRVSRETWEAEMLCRRPSVRGCVFPSFSVESHVTASSPTSATAPTLHLGIDFGFAHPFVCLWLRDDGRVVHVIDEYVQPQRTIIEHLQQIQLRQHGAVEWVACDPAGSARSEQTAMSNIALLRAAGFRVRYRTSRIVDGLELIRAALHPAHGAPALRVHPRCVRLIRALRGYRYPSGGGELPVKDGTHDHLIDALRYFFVNRRSGAVKVSNY